MGGEERFDSFYRATRDSLLLQTVLVTGDRDRSLDSVREAYSDAWHHWRRVARSDHPEGWVRVRAWRRSHAHRTGPHDSEGAPPPDSSPPDSSPPGSSPDGEVLAALDLLTPAERSMLVLTEVAELRLPEAAREAGVPADEVETTTRRARRRLATALDVDPAAVGGRLRSVRAPGDARLPRATIIRRAGRRRRRSRFLVAAMATTLVLVATGGVVAYEPPGEAKARSKPDDTGATPSPTTATPAKPARETPPTAADLLDEHQITRLGLGREWRVTRTHDNTAGDGTNTTCQQTRFADPDGRSALVRRFEARGGPDRSAVQTVEVSRTTGQARKAFRTTLGWYAGCQVGRLQLLESYRVDHIGDQADVLTMRVWRRPVTAYSVAVARIGRVVTSTVATTRGRGSAPAGEIVQSLADSVAMLCANSGAQDCAKRPAFAVVPPPPSGEERGVLAVADLPPVGRVTRPWVGTDTRPARFNPSATICDRADFGRAGARTIRTRTFLIPGARVPDRFGLSETYGVLASPRGAARFLTGVRERVRSCEDRIQGAQVSRPRTAHKPRSGAVSVLWEVETAVAEGVSVRFRLGFVRVGRTVAQVSLSPTEGEDMTRQQFDGLVVRAGDRLRELGQGGTRPRAGQPPSSG